MQHASLAGNHLACAAWAASLSPSPEGFKRNAFNNVATVIDAFEDKIKASIGSTVRPSLLLFGSAFAGLGGLRPVDGMGEVGGGRFRRGIKAGRRRRLPRSGAAAGRGTTACGRRHSTRSPTSLRRVNRGCAAGGCCGQLAGGWRPSACLCCLCHVCWLLPAEPQPHPCLACPSPASPCAVRQGSSGHQGRGQVFPCQDY